MSSARCVHGNDPQTCPMRHTTHPWPEGNPFLTPGTTDAPPAIQAGGSATKDEQIEYLRKVVRAQSEEIKGLKLKITGMSLDRAVETNILERKVEVLARMEAKLGEQRAIVVVPKRPWWAFWRRK